jgi:queuine tRNA-ribosyltransferase
VNLTNATITRDPLPIEEGCTCPACREFSRAYLRHLIKAEEILGLRLVTLHNLHFYITLMGKIRNAILDGSFAEFRQKFVAGYRVWKAEEKEV